ncbi:Conserved_hypothetical protein [Hexamita inflata]|uniref:Uncharacterized protein n=1 Tax=Hexamita inflata TaxID=28002 RepID=A0AA86N3Y8_9EUKA|nr:Conserved hypothetical protein [Hexamita inflata]
MQNLKTLDIGYTKIVDLHPLQYLYQLESIIAPCTRIIDVSPLSKLTQILKALNLSNNKINNADSLKHGETLKHHQNFSKYNFSYQNVPTPDELKFFYSKILSVHSSHKQIRNIMNDNKNTKFRISLTLQKYVVSTGFDNYARKMNTQLELLVYFIQSSNAQLQ